jgi:D-glycero-D-manno-heptose 1,7-bisphosphate phosphatase
MVAGASPRRRDACQMDETMGSPPAADGREAARPPVAFFDRDDTLIEDKPYQCDPAGMVVMPGAISAVRLLNRRGWRVAVVTNQSAVARGYCTEAAVRRFHRVMADVFAREGARIDVFEFCPYHEDAIDDGYRVADHPDRKPNPGMIERVLVRDKADRSRSFLIGDRESDMVAAQRAGIAGYLFDGSQSLPSLVEAILNSMGTGTGA